MWLFSEVYDQESKRGTMDNDADRAKFLDENREAIEASVLEFLKQNPGKNLTYTDMEAIVRSAAKRPQD